MSVIKLGLDPGHGGSDLGTIGQKAKEKDVVLKIALKVRDILSQYENVEIYMTRTTDVDVSLEERAKFANSVGATGFISIHANAASSPKARGTEVWVWKKGYEAEKMALSILRALAQIPYPSLLPRYCIATEGNQFETYLLQDDVLQATIPLAYYELDNRGVKEANFYVLKYTTMPAVLVETAFITNPEEEDMLINRYEEFAQAIADGIVKYYGLTPKPKEKTWEEIQQEALVWAKTVGLLNSPHDINESMTVGLWAVLEKRKREDLKWY